MHGGSACAALGQKVLFSNSERHIHCYFITGQDITYRQTVPAFTALILIGIFRGRYISYDRTTLRLSDTAAMTAVVTLAGYQHLLPPVAWNISDDKTWMRAKMRFNIRSGQLNLRFAESWLTPKGFSVCGDKLKSVFIDSLVAIVTQLDATEHRGYQKRSPRSDNNTLL